MRIIQIILVYEAHLELKLQADIDAFIRMETMEDSANFNQGIENLNCYIVQSARKRRQGDPNPLIDLLQNAKDAERRALELMSK